jgi:TetR/AcrR family transcriptional repressor of nem operon
VKPPRRPATRTAAASSRTAGTASRILDVAERLVQTRGFNAFSYADIAEALGVQKASLHHHFATKADLGLALIERCRGDFVAALAAIAGESADGRERLRRYAELYGAVMRRKRMCLCGMMAADVATLPRPIKESLAEFFAENESWLERVLDEGRSAGELAFEGSPRSLAAFIVASLEGAMLVARGSSRAEEFDVAAERLLEMVGAARGR